ncbi:hypothetical protein OC845_005729 [Tilletia horrida]|nr:hypothetical protein OC845_005729 [Tilletia horrida]
MYPPPGTSTASAGSFQTGTTNTSNAPDHELPQRRRIVGSGSNTELRAQIRKERRLQQQQGQSSSYNHNVASASGASSAAVALPSAGAFSTTNLGSQTQKQAAAPSAGPARPTASGAATTRFKSTEDLTAFSTATSATGRRTASASSAQGSSAAPSRPPSQTDHASAAASTSNTQTLRTQSRQQLLVPPSVSLHRPISASNHGPAASANFTPMPESHQDHTAFSTVSQVSTMGHGSLHSHGRTSSQGHHPAQVPSIHQQLGWHPELQPEVHTNVIDAIIAKFQNKYAEAALKCKDWQAYAAKLKTQSRALNVENRLLRQLNERQQEQIQMLKLKLDSACNERDRSDFERARLEGQVEQLESILIARSGPAGQYATQANLQHYDDAVVVPDPSQTGPYAQLPLQRQQVQHAHLGSASTSRRHLHQGGFGSASAGPHLNVAHGNSSHDVEHSELYQTALDAANMVFENGLDMSVPSAPRWDDAEEQHRRRRSNSASRDLQQSQPAPAQPVRVLRRSGNLVVPGHRSVSSRSGSNGRSIPRSATTSDHGFESSEESGSESESEPELERRASVRALTGRSPGRISDQQVVSERPPSPTGYQDTQRGSSGFCSLPSPEDVYRNSQSGQSLHAQASPPPNSVIPMHMHSSPPFQMSSSASGRGTRTDAYIHQASLLGTVANAHAPSHQRDPSGFDRPYRAPHQHQDAGKEMTGLVSPPSFSPALELREVLQDDDGEAGSPEDILDLDAERREEIGPSPLIGYGHDDLFDAHEPFEAMIGTGSPMPLQPYGLGLRNGNTLMTEAAYRPSGFEPAPLGVPPSDSHKTLVEDVDEDAKEVQAPANLRGPKPSASVRSNGAQRYTVISPMRSRASSNARGDQAAENRNLTFSSLAPPAAATKRPTAPPVTSLNAANQGHLARKRSTNSTDADIVRTSASIPTLPFLPHSHSAPAGLSDVTNLPRPGGNGDLLAPNISQGKIRAPSAVSEAPTVKHSQVRPEGSTDKDQRESLPISVAESRQSNGPESRPSGWNITQGQRHSLIRTGSESSTGPVPTQTLENVTAPQMLQRPGSRAASRNSNLSTTGFQMVGLANTGGSGSSSLNLNRASASQLSVHSIGGEQLSRNRNRSRASSHSVHDAIPIIVKDDVFSGSLDGTGSGGITPIPSPLFGPSQTSVTAGGPSHFGTSITSSNPASLSNSASLHNQNVPRAGGESLVLPQYQSRNSASGPTYTGAGQNGTYQGEQEAKEDRNMMLPRGRSSSTLASTHASLSPDVQGHQRVLSGPMGSMNATVAPECGLGITTVDRSGHEIDHPRGISASGLAALSPSISRARRTVLSGDAHATGAHQSFSGDDGYQEYNASMAHDHGADGYGYDDGEADGVGPHRQLYARLRATLDEAQLAKFERYVHRYDALDIPLEGPRGLVNRVRKLFLRGEPDLAQRPERLRLMKELLREFESLVRGELPSVPARV